MDTKIRLLSFLAILTSNLLAGCSTIAPTADTNFDDLLERIQTVTTSGRLSDNAYVAGKLGCSVDVLNDPLRPVGAEIHDYVLHDCLSPVRKDASTPYRTLGPDGKTKGGYIDFADFETSKVPSKANVISLAARRFGKPECKDERREGTMFTYCAFVPSGQLPVGGIGLLYQESYLLIGLTIWGYDR